MFTRNKGMLLMIIGYFLPVVNLITTETFPSFGGTYNEITKKGLSFFSYPLFNFESIVFFIFIAYSLIKKNRLIGLIPVGISIIHFLNFHKLVFVFLFNGSGKIQPGIFTLIYLLGCIAFLFGKE